MRGQWGLGLESRDWGSSATRQPCDLDNPSSPCLSWLIYKVETSLHSSTRLQCYDWQVAALGGRWRLLKVTLCPPFSPQIQGRVLLLTTCAAGIGGTFQFGYNLSIINAPTLVCIFCACHPHPGRCGGRLTVACCGVWAGIHFVVLPPNTHTHPPSLRWPTGPTDAGSNPALHPPLNLDVLLGP